MSKLIALLQLLAASRATSFGPWPRRLLRRLAVGLALLMTGSILTGVLITVGLFWGYQEALARGISSDDALLAVALTIGALIVATGIGLAYCIKEVKSQLSGFNLTRQVPVASQFSNTIHDAVQGFMDGFTRSGTANNNASARSTGTSHFR